MEFTFKSKFNLEDIVWFMYDNKPAQGIVYKINYKREESVKTAYEHRNIFNKLKSLLNSKKVSVALSYGLDMVRSDKSYISMVR